MSPNGMLIGSVLVFIVLVQAWILWAAQQTRKRADDRTILDELFTEFGKDIERRARQWQAPDWIRYMEDAERGFELHIDRLRTFAAAALAVGLGGTIVSLIANLVFEILTKAADDTIVVKEIIQGTVVSLLGSLAGVVVHLLIVLLMMRKSEDAFSRDFHAWRRKLQAISEQHETREAFTEVLLQGMAPIRNALKDDLAGVFGTAIPGFPSAVADLGQNLERLSQVVEKQGSTIEAAVANLQETASAMEQLAPAAEVLAGASIALGVLPERLESTLTESRERWLADLRQEEGTHLQELLGFHRELEEKSEARERQMTGLVRDLQNAVAEVRDEIHRVPGLLTETIAGLSRQLGIEFGQHARDSVNELAAHLKDQQEILLLRLEKREQELRNNVGLIVKELFDQLSGTIEHQIVDKLEIVGQELRQAAEALPAAAQRFEDASGSWYQVQEESLRSWSDVANRIEGAAELLGSTDGQLKVTVKSIGTAADHLERVAILTDQFEQSLRQALHDAAAEPLKDLIEIRLELQAIVTSSRDYQEKLENILSKQASFIQDCINSMLNGNGMDSSHSPAGGPS